MRRDRTLGERRREPPSADRPFKVSFDRSPPPPPSSTLFPRWLGRCNAFTMLIKFIKRTNRVSSIRIETRPPLTSIVSLPYHRVIIRVLFPRNHRYYLLIPERKLLSEKSSRPSDPTTDIISAAKRAVVQRFLLERIRYKSVQRYSLWIMVEK